VKAGVYTTLGLH